jgi:Subtilase family
MKLHTRSATLAALLMTTSPAVLAVFPAHPQPAYREGEVLVKYRAGASPGEVQALHAKLGLLAKSTMARGRTELLRLPRITTTEAAVELLRDDPAVAIAEPNFLRFPRAACPDNPALSCPNDTYFGELWGLRSTGQANYFSPDLALASIPGADMDLLLAWDPGADGTFERVGDGVTIALVDDSFEVTHPDLAANFVAGYDFENDDDDPSPGFGEQHGTLVAGAAGAIGNNGIGVAGTAWNARLMPLKFGFDVASHIAALEFARNHGATIVNASFGGATTSGMELDAISDLAANDILYVAAAGNEDSNTDIAQLNFPANYDVPNIVAVAATNRQDAIASFSQYGAIATDVAAPGLQVVTTTNGDDYSLPVDCATDGSCGVAGTSFSAPYTAGVAALIRSAYPVATVAEVKARLIEGAEPGDGVTLRTAGGRVNAAHSLDIAPRPALVIKDFTLLDADGNATLDPGESLQAQVTLENLWLPATGVTGTLSADNGVTVTSGAADFGDVDSGATATATFDLDVAAGITEHRYEHFTLALGANGGAYTATRGFISEIGELIPGTTITQDFAARDDDLYDEFHAWHFDFDGVMPEGHSQLVFETSSAAPGFASPDIDLLAKFGVPPRYNIAVGTVGGIFCTDSNRFTCQDPNAAVSAGSTGSERVVFSNPHAGTYHVVVVNFAHLPDGLTYTLRPYTRAAPPRPSSAGTGSLPLPALLVFALSALVRLRRRAA